MHFVAGCLPNALNVVLMFSHHQVTLQFTQKFISFLVLVSIYKHRCNVDICIALSFERGIA